MKFYFTPYNFIYSEPLYIKALLNKAFFHNKNIKLYDYFSVFYFLNQIKIILILKFCKFKFIDNFLSLK